MSNASYSIHNIALYCGGKGSNTHIHTHTLSQYICKVSLQEEAVSAALVAHCKMKGNL